MESVQQEVEKLKHDIRASQELARETRQINRNQLARIRNHEIIGPILRLEDEARNGREMIDDLVEAQAEGDTELLRVVKKWIQRHNEEIEDLLDETQGA